MNKIDKEKFREYLKILSTYVPKDSPRYNLIKDIEEDLEGGYFDD